MRILLTGANGFLGQRLSSDLLEEGHELYLLVRNEKKLNSFMESIDETFKPRIHIIEGHITSSQLGLSEDLLTKLKGKVDAIYHMAALLSFDPKDEELTYTVNVEGTRNVLDFAKKIQVGKFLYVSTAYTVGTEVKGHEDLYSSTRDFVNSYEKTKCEAEHLVYSYGDELSVAILRPAIIIGDSKTGRADTSFGLYGIMKSLSVLKKKMLRKTEMQNKTYRLVIDQDVASNIVPVDYVSSVLVSALTHSKNREIFNITNENPPKQGKVFDIVKEYLELPNIEMIPFKDVHQLREEEIIFNKPLAVFSNYLGRDIHFSCENTKALLAKNSQPKLNMDEKMIHTIIGGYYKQQEKH